MSYPLLLTRQADGGECSAWLKKLGIQEDFFKLYPLAKLVDWKWLVPQFRVVFPESFFTTGWPNYPEQPNTNPSEIDATAKSYNLLWSSVWFGDDENEFLWFLHPFFRPGNPTGSLLCEYRVTDEALPKISPIQHPNGHVIEPVVDYYFHWQAYALIDVIRAADCFKTPILNVPDATERARRLVGLTKGTQRDLSSILSSPSRWGGLAEPMTWISHYRQFRVASGDFEIRYGEQRGRLKRGAVVSQAPIGQAMLCCLAARNYFAHHVYRDQELLNKKSSKFLLGGILLAVLTLLNN